MLTEDPITLARVLAEIAHRGQTRKYTGEPYHVHTREVARLVGSAGASLAAVAAAHLHDIVEDTPWTHEDVRRVFGDTIARLVNEVTDISTMRDGNRAKRKALDRQHLALASPDGKTIKLADLIDNTSTIVKHDPGFAKTYMAEKRDLLPVLVGGDPVLHARAVQIVSDYFGRGAST